MHLARLLPILQIPHRDRVVGVVVRLDVLPDAQRRARGGVLAPVTLCETECECVPWPEVPSASCRLFKFDSSDLRRAGG
jgi:hypothetical protein